MHHKNRPAECEPGSMNGRAPELWARVCQSRERLAASELAKTGRAWRLWSACIDQTEGWQREADTIYIGTLARAAGAMDRKAASRLMRRFDELGIMAWQAAPRGSHGISLLTLPPLAGQRLHGVPTPHEDAHGVPTPHVAAPSWGAHAPLQSTMHGAECVVAEPNALSAPSGTHGHDGAPGQRSSEGEWRASLGTPAGEADPHEDEAMREAGRAFLAEIGMGGTVARFGEAEPAALTDTDAHLLRRRRP